MRIKFELFHFPYINSNFVSFHFTQFSLQILALHPLLAKLTYFEPANGQKVLYVYSSYDLGDGSTALESPKGCFQYFLQPKGYLTSFAFETNGQYLNDQVRIVIFFRVEQTRFEVRGNVGKKHYKKVY